MFSSISVDDFLKQDINTLNVIDIRSRESYNNRHIERALNVPFDKLLANPSSYMKPNIRYYLYCQKGITSAKICQILTRMGYKVTNIAGGYEEWVMKR